MKKFIAIAVLACISTPLHAATVNFMGATTNVSTAFPTIGTSVSLGLTYTPAPVSGGLNAVVTAATLSVGGEQWNVLAGGATDQISIVDNAAANEDLQVGLTFGPSSPSSFGPTLSSLSLAITGGAELGAAPDATEANVNMLTSYGTPGSGTLTLFDIGSGAVSSVSFSGIATPEPSSMALLGGLALFGGVQVVRRRRKNAAEKTITC